MEYSSQLTDNVHILIFADAAATLADTCSQFQTNIKVFEQFSIATGTKFNLNKSKIIIFRNGGPLRAYEK